MIFSSHAFLQQIVNTEKKCMETNTTVRLVRFGVELKKFYIRNTR
jgi:hypothetical protein